REIRVGTNHYSTRCALHQVIGQMARAAGEVQHGQLCIPDQFEERERDQMSRLTVTVEEVVERIDVRTRSQDTAGWMIEALEKIFSRQMLPLFEEPCPYGLTL